MDSLTGVGKILIFTGIIIVIAGIILLILGHSGIRFFGKLPGDIYIKRDNFVFYFPVVSAIILSIILTIILNLIFLFFGRK